MTEQSPQKTEEPAEEVEAAEEAAAEDAAGEEGVVAEGEQPKPRPARRKRRTAQDPPLTAEELRDKVVGWGERLGTALVGFVTRMVDETTEKVENVADRVARDLEDEDDDEGETAREKS